MAGTLGPLSTPPLLILLDLDNTLVDRAGAFRRWAELFAAELGRPEEADFIVAEDRNGHTPRPRLAATLASRFDLDSSPAAVSALVERMLYEHVEFVEVYDGLAEHLELLADDGLRLAILSNGPVEQQGRKLRRTGIDARMVDTVVSQGVGLAKPDVRIFELALERAGGDPSRTWMVGDDPVNDVAGGRAAGLRTGWVGHGTVWAERGDPLGPPTVEAATTREVLELIRSR
ncbi:HAD family hydrolase [Herbiconiux sp. P15]|uniref:HAD family hydrolase n=1 Tax=Herbiconiux liukaitaii TaxID=3342799 RepID=UPI0035BB1974